MRADKDTCVRAVWVLWSMLGHGPEAFRPPEEGRDRET